MGFSLEHFFETLEFLLTDGNVSDADRIRALKETVEESKEYAIRCGVIDAN